MNDDVWGKEYNIVIRLFMAYTPCDMTEERILKDHPINTEERCEVKLDISRTKSSSQVKTGRAPDINGVPQEVFKIASSIEPKWMLNIMNSSQTLQIFLDL